MTAVCGPSEQELAAYPADAPAVIMLHSFDSSCLELRRLYPLLAQSLPTYALDVVRTSSSCMHACCSVLHVCPCSLPLLAHHHTSCLSPFPPTWRAWSGAS
jgi:hypothetical protein